MFVFNLIPFFGPFIGAIPCTLLILLVDPLKALWFVILICVLQQFDGNVIGPMILGNHTGLTSFWIIFSIFLFGGLFGFVGMIIGVPTFAVIYSLIRALVEKRLRQKGMPVSTRDYMKMRHVVPEDSLVIVEETTKEMRKPRIFTKKQKVPADEMCIRDSVGILQNQFAVPAFVNLFVQNIPRMEGDDSAVFTGAVFRVCCHEMAHDIHNVVVLNPSGAVFVDLHRIGNAVAQTIEFGRAGVPGRKMFWDDLPHPCGGLVIPVSYTHLDVYKRKELNPHKEQTASFRKGRFVLCVSRRFGTAVKVKSRRSLC